MTLSAGVVSLEMHWKNKCLETEFCSEFTPTEVLSNFKRLAEFARSDRVFVQPLLDNKLTSCSYTQICHLMVKIKCANGMIAIVVCFIHLF